MKEAFGIKRRTPASNRPGRPAGAAGEDNGPESGAPARGFLGNGPESGVPACVLLETVLETVLEAVLWLGFGLETVNTK